MNGGNIKMSEVVAYRIKRKKFREILFLIHDAINQVAFNNELPKSKLSLYSCSGTLGYAFKEIDEKRGLITYININPLLAYFYSDTDMMDFFYRATDILFHEMIHVYDYVHGVVDVDDHKTQYHNEQFGKAAREHGLICEHFAECGFATILPFSLFWKIAVYFMDEISKRLNPSEDIVGYTYLPRIMKENSKLINFYVYDDISDEDEAIEDTAPEATPKDSSPSE